MTQLEAQLANGPEAVEALFLAAARPLSLHDPSYSWHGLAEGSASKAISALSAGNVPLGLSWTRCAVAIYDALASDVAEWNSFDVSRMYTRARAIRVCGSRDGDSVLDPDVVFRWVRSALLPSIEEALDLSEKFRHALANQGEPSLADGRKLRRIKNRLGVIDYLATTCPIPADLRAWLDVRRKLV